MSKVCELTGKSKLKGHRVSHSNRKAKRFQNPNIQKRKFAVPELGRSFTLTLSATALRTIIARGGLARAILLEKEENLSQRLKSVRRALTKPGTKKRPSNREVAREA